MDPQRSGVLLAGSCFALVGCAAQGHGWAYNSCGDPRATEIASLDGGPGAGPGAGSACIDTNTLLYEMTALGALARRPPSSFRTCMVSSYDRHSTVPQASSDTPTGWFANHDWGNFVGQETGPAGESEFVLLDADGPGAVVRIWSPSRDGKPNGTLRIYVDRGGTPALEAPMVALLAGQIAPFSSPFAGTTAEGGNLEFPLPFREHVKVTWDGTGGYYQVTFRKYAAPAPDVTSLDLAAVDLGLLDLVRLQLQQPTLADSGNTSSQSVLSASSPELAVAASPGGEEILALQIRPNLVDAASLRSSVLSLRFDGQESVRVPLGDFFGAGPGLLPHSTLPLDVGPDGVFTARFVMPFAQSAVVRVDAAAGLEATVTVLHEAAPFDSSTLGSSASSAIFTAANYRQLSGGA